MKALTYFSVDFDKSLTSVPVGLPEKLIHKAIGSASAKPVNTAERGFPVNFVDLPSKALSVTLIGIPPGESSERHRRSYETIIYVLEGCGYSMIEDRRVDWQAGDAVYIPPWVWHHHVNLDGENAVKYLACENAPMVHNKGR